MMRFVEIGSLRAALLVLGAIASNSSSAAAQEAAATRSARTQDELQLFLAASLNQPPQIDPLPDRTVDEETTLTFVVTASDPDQPPQTLTFRLGAGALTGATLNPTNGLFSWTPSEAVGPATVRFSVIVTDDGSPSLSETQRFSVFVLEVNRPPIIQPVPEQSFNEGDLVFVSIQVEDPDLPFQVPTVSLLEGPSGASVTPGGLFLWTPGEDQGPGTNQVVVTASDDGSPSLSATQRFTVIVREVNSPPALPAIPEQSVGEGELLAFTVPATDMDVPAQRLTFTLGAGAPEGASINPTNGLFTWIPPEVYGPGSYFFSVTVTDDGVPALSESQGFIVVVSEVNRAPELPVLPDRTVNEGEAIALSVLGTDADVPAQTLTYSLGPGAPEGALLTEGGFFFWAPGEAQGPGTSEIAIVLSDSGTPSLSSTQRFTVVVREINHAPVLGALADWTVNEGELIRFTAQASDVNLPPQSLTFTLGAGAPAGASVDAQTGAFTWTPAEAQGPDSYQIGIIVTDSGSPPAAAALSFAVTVNEVNQRPVLPPLADQVVNQGGLLVFTVPASDADVPSQTLVFSLLPGAPAGAGVSVDGLFTWAPGLEQVFTSNRISVVVSDGSLSATQSFSVAVVAPNFSPTLAPIPDWTVREEEFIQFTVEASDANRPAQNLEFRLGSGAPAGAAIDPRTGVFTWTPGEAQGGTTNLIGVLVMDDGTPPLSAGQTFQVVVNEIHSPPVLPPLEDRTVNLGGFLVFTIAASDPDIPTQPLTFRLGAGAPTGAALTADGLFTWAPTQAQGMTTNSLTVIVTDGSLSATQSFTVIVNEPNLAPRLGPITNFTVLEGNTLTFTVTATDPNGAGQHLTFSLSGAAPSGASLDPQTGVFMWTPGETQGGTTNVIGVIVTDDGTPALSAGVIFTVIVQEVNSPPVLPPIAGQTVNEGGLLVFTIPASDPDIPAQTLFFSLDRGAPAGARVTTDGLFTWEPRPSQVLTTNRLTVMVSDGSLGATQSFTVVVLEVNLAPTLAAITNRTVNEGELVLFTVEASDPNQSAQALTFSLGAGAPIGAGINPTNGVFFWTPDESQGPSTNQISVIVTDNGTPPLSAAQSCIIFVRELNRPPTLAPIPDQSASPGELFVLTAIATDPDLPAQPLTFSLRGGAPEGAAISSGGLFAWTPTHAQAGTSNLIGIIVTDGSLTATQSFALVVRGGAITPPRLENPAFIANTFRASVDSVAGRRYFLERTVFLNPLLWEPVSEFLGIGGTMSLTDPGATNAHSAYRARVQ
jgi:hypothetical protein